MARWLFSWFGYYQRLYGQGLVVLFAIAGSGLVALLLIGVPLYVTAALFTFAIDERTVLLAAAIIALPPLTAAALRASRPSDRPFKRPPSWREHKAGVPLPTRPPN